MGWIVLNAVIAAMQMAVIQPLGIVAASLDGQVNQSSTLGIKNDSINKIGSILPFCFCGQSGSCLRSTCKLGTPSMC